MAQPLVVTLAIDDDAQAHFDSERARLFPRTRVGAHVTLFHAVPQDLPVEQDLRELAGPAFAVAVASVRSLGRGVAYFLESEELLSRHRELQNRWRERLTRQDQQGFRPHITVQNKVSSEEAHATMAALQNDFTPFEITALGFRVWRYEPDGTWTPLAHVPFPS